jgi:hypothetical protein
MDYSTYAALVIIGTVMGVTVWGGKKTGPYQGPKYDLYARSYFGMRDCPFRIITISVTVLTLAPLLPSLYRSFGMKGALSMIGVGVFLNIAIPFIMLAGRNLDP